MDRLRVGVVGVGYLGRFHALIYSRLPGVELVGVADTSAEIAQQVATEAGCAAYVDGKDLLGQVDAVSVVVPTTAHLAVARPFLEHGVHVLLEKPIATTAAEGRAIVQLARRSGAVLQVGHLERYNGGVMALAARIAEPKFIEAHRMSGFVARATDVDVISDLMIHDIDIILSLVRSDIVSIAAVGTPVLTGHIDIANARLEFANGAVANVIASRVSRDKSRRIRIFQERCYLSLDFIEQHLDVVYPHDRPGEEWPEIVSERVTIEPVKPLDAEIADFIACVRERREPLVSGEVGVEALEVALAVKERILSRR
jgi:predicted dehydrogenase